MDTPDAVTAAGLVAVLTSGTVAGVLFSVARAVAPTFESLPGDCWVQVHQLLDPHFDPFMPRVTKLTMGSALVVAGFGQPLAARILFGLGFAASVGVALVSELRNVPMNHMVLTWDADALPEGWAAVREDWRRANLVRTVCAGSAFALYAAGMVVLR